MSRNKYSFRPQVEVLTDRLAPGSLLGTTALAESSSDSNAVDEEAADLALVALEAAHRSTQSVFFFDGTEVAGSSSTLVRNSDGVSMTLQTSDLEPGAYTVWWIMFKNPDGCVDPNACGTHDEDFAVDGPAGFGFGYATGHVVGSSGTATFAANLQEGEVLMQDDGSPIVFEDSMTTEIHLIVRYHGEADPGRIDEQIHTGEFEDCDVCEDVQFAVHPVP